MRQPILFFTLSIYIHIYTNVQIGSISWPWTMTTAFSFTSPLFFFVWFLCSTIRKKKRTNEERIVSNGKERETERKWSVVAIWWSINRRQRLRNRIFYDVLIWRVSFSQFYLTKYNELRNFLNSSHHIYLIKVRLLLIRQV